MISINNLSFYFGDRPLYQNLNWHIKPKDRIALIGANGTGKTTLLRLITAQYKPDEGDISRAKDCSIGYLNQDLLSYESDKSILDVCLEAFESVVKLEGEINDILSQMELNYSDELMNQLAEKQELFEAGEGYVLKSRAEEILEGLGFTTPELSKPLKNFSGGWRMRVMLAKLLLQKPALLLLDEPTNHLDLPTIEWIEKYLSNYDGAYIVVSHDREFLNNTAGIVAELSQRSVNLYKGNYDDYLIEREEQRLIQHNSHVNQQKKIKETEQFINKFRAKATKSRQVQSRVKALEKIDIIDDVASDDAVMNLRFKVDIQPGRTLYELNKISKSYGDLTILENATARIEKGDKIAFIGANGKGKSTMLRIIDGSEPCLGEVVEGYNVNKTFFAQHQLESLGQDNTLLAELVQSGSRKTEQELRSVLGCFLFGDEAITKKIKMLSGGEKSRVALAKTLISNSNFLLLDEPTNHLDIKSVNTLIEALVQYEGSFVVVSHNRDFIASIATKIWYIENHELKEYPGTYDEFIWWREKNQKQTVLETRKPEPQKVKPVAIDNDEEFKLKEKHLKKLKGKLAESEKNIESFQSLKDTLESEMAKESVYTNPILLSEKTKELNVLETKLLEENNLWLALAEELEN